MSVGATVGAATTGARLLGELPVLGDLLGDIPVIGGLFGGGPEDMDSGEVHGKLYAGNWRELDDEMEPRSVSGAESDVRELRDRMRQSPEIRQLVNDFASGLIRKLRSQGLAQSDTRDPRPGAESARVIVWAKRGGVGSSWDQGPVAVAPAREVFNTPVPEPEPQAQASTSSGESSSDNTMLLAVGAGLAAFLLAR